MKTIQTLLSRALMNGFAIATGFLLIGCTSGNNIQVGPRIDLTSQPPPEAKSAAPEPYSLNLFSADELFAFGGGGCGMTLLPAPGELPDADNPEGMLLFNGIEGPMLMKINQEMVRFEREDSQGEPFYGQTTQQTFINPELGLIVDVEVQLGQLGEIESVDLPEGRVRLSSEVGDTKEQGDIDRLSKTIRVTGDAGC